ncbi:MAG: Mu transposase C-terminal domain-containing protein [Desulfobacteraceae bacterium]|nr:Mu transposase C-terminal domain-containing protein [Desulfobacteraceae bacterium]
MKSELSAKEIADILGITPRAVQKRAAKEKWDFRELANGRGGGSVKLYRFASFPKELRDTISDRELQETLKAVPSVIESSPTPVLRHASPVAQAIVPEKSDKIGRAKYLLVEAWRNVVASQPRGRKDEATSAFLLAYRTGRLLPDVHRLLGDVSAPTLYRLDKKLRDSGNDYLAVSDGRGGWKKYGTTKWKPRELSMEAQKYLLACYLDPKRPTVIESIHAARMLLAKRGLEEPAHESAWRRWLKDFESRHQHVTVLAREGEKAYKDLFGPYITRDSSLLEVGQVLVADGHTLNFQVLHPQTGRPARMTLIAWFDWASRYPVGWQLMPTENTVAISAALRMAIETLGKFPQAVYIDNGKAFKSRYFTETSPDLAELTGLYARLGIATVFSTPYNARAKVIERFWLTLGVQCERLIPSYCGSSIDDKPAWMARNEKFHKAWHEAKTRNWIPTIREAAHLLSIYFNWYVREPHDGLGGRTPLEVLDSGRGPGVDTAALDRQFLWAQTATATRCRVTLMGIDYESDCLHGISGKITVRYDTADLRTIHCYLPDGRYLGDASPVQALHPLAKLFGNEVCVDQLKAALKRQRKLARDTKENLLALGAAPDHAESLTALPWTQKIAVLPGGRTADAPPLSPAEEKRLSLVCARAEAEEPASGPERPEWFRSEAARYEWCFRARYQHRFTLDDEDAAFMAYFEHTREYAENYRQRYEDLKELYTLNGIACLHVQ